MDRAKPVNYSPSWQAQGLDYDAEWNVRHDGLRIGAEQMRTAAIMAAWQQMRTYLPRECWSVEACDAMTEAVLRRVRDWIGAPGDEA